MNAVAIRDILERSTVSPYREMVAFEYLYSLEGMTLKKIADLTINRNMLPSQAVEERTGLFDAEGMDEVREFIDGKLATFPFQVAVKGTSTWPAGIADSARPSPVVYFAGNIGLLGTPRVSVVGSRKASQDGLARAARMGRLLAESGVTVVSGLAAGIDSAAMKAAANVRERGEYCPVIGVIGTPIDECYPRQNVDLQAYVANSGLLISQVPFYRYSKQPFKTKRYYFPERNELMAAVSDATVIIEASDTSGTLTQARACEHQGRPLFILKSCVENPEVTWPRKWVGKDNVHVVNDVDDVLAEVI